MGLAQNLKKRRKDKKLTQVELAHKSGVSQQAISFIESERNTPSEGTLKLLAKALDCTIAELIGETAVDQDGLSPSERQLILDYRHLTPEGQEYIQHQMFMALNIYIQCEAVSDLQAVNK